MKQALFLTKINVKCEQILGGRGTAVERVAQQDPMKMARQDFFWSKFWHIHVKGWPTLA